MLIVENYKKLNFGPLRSIRAVMIWPKSHIFFVFDSGNVTFCRSSMNFVSKLHSGVRNRSCIEIESVLKYLCCDNANLCGFQHMLLCICKQNLSCPNTNISTLDIDLNTRAISNSRVIRVYRSLLNS
jgi:hypothetical protein